MKYVKGGWTGLNGTALPVWVPCAGLLLLSEPWPSWNPWHGCTKNIPRLCLATAMYRGDERRGSWTPLSGVYRTGDYDLPLKKKNEMDAGKKKFHRGRWFGPVFSSDFLLEEGGRVAALGMGYDSGPEGFEIFLHY